MQSTRNERCTGRNDWKLKTRRVGRRESDFKRKSRALRRVPSFSLVAANLKIFSQKRGFRPCPVRPEGVQFREKKENRRPVLTTSKKIRRHRLRLDSANSHHWNFCAAGRGGVASETMPDRSSVVRLAASALVLGLSILVQTNGQLLGLVNWRAESTLWLNATFRAEDAGVNLSAVCQPLLTYKALLAETLSDAEAANLTQNWTRVSVDDPDGDRKSVTLNLSEPEPMLWIKNKSAAETVGMNVSLLDRYGVVAVNLERVCAMEPRVLWLNTSNDAVAHSLNTSVICAPFLANQEANATDLVDVFLELGANNTHVDANGLVDDDDDDKDGVQQQFRTTPRRRHGRQVTVQPTSDGVTSAPSAHSSSGLSANVSDDAEPILYVNGEAGANKLNLDPALFELHESIAIYLPGACQPPEQLHSQAVKNFNASEALGVDIDQAIGIDVSQIDGNLTQLEEQLRNDTDLDAIIKTFNESDGEPMLGGSYILPILKKANYDRFTPPAIFENQTIIIRMGFYVESISDFSTQSMDYETDIYFRMAWRDSRLIHKLNRTINVKEQEIRDQIWMPDPYFPNAKEATFHEVTFLNFLLRVLPDGQVFYMIRIKLKPTCHLILCKFPHDVQECHLKIKSFAYTVDYLKFEWFTDPKDAISLNNDLQFPELYVDSYRAQECDGQNQIGNFTCLDASFTLKRDLGFYIAQMYVPTTLALTFSWVGVWLPDEMMEARIGVAITVLLTLSTESMGSQEHLPTVSYMKAIDIWFGFITAFVFCTLLQTLIVVIISKKSSLSMKRAARKREDVEEREKLELAARRYRKLAVTMDIGCRIFYPTLFFGFCLLYFLYLTKGAQDDCIKK